MTYQEPYHKLFIQHLFCVDDNSRQDETIGRYCYQMEEQQGIVTEQYLRQVNEKTAKVLQSGLFAYEAARKTLRAYIADEHAAADHRQQLWYYGQQIGLDFLVVNRVVDMLREQWPNVDTSLDVRPAVPLLTHLGESYALLAFVDSVDDARHIPIISMEQVCALYTEDVHAWLRQYVDSLPGWTRE